MEVSALRQEYRSSREQQRRNIQVLLFTAAAAEMSEAVSIVPVAQCLTSPREPNGTSSPPSSDIYPDPKICDPWHVHLDLHRRSRPAISSRFSCSSSSEVRSTRASDSSRNPTEENDNSFDGNVTGREHFKEEMVQDPSGSLTQSPVCRATISPSTSRDLQENSGGPRWKHYPFPSRRTRRVSEAARRMGMYSSSSP
ncbi:uncharacterized protein KZ484_018636 [Pholidichthys leucotaenia]